ncbi:MAG: hypothetical protein OXF98_04885, partial [Rhodospirillaceae bacterium]|nr:hypothetical protein [Rhodospirillaceae bacterium]
MFFDRPEPGRRAVLLSLRLGDGRGRLVPAAACVAAAGTSETRPSRAAVDDEFRHLVESAEIRPARLVAGARPRPHPRWFAG